MARYGMVIDTTRCTACYNCFLACRDEFCGNDYPPYSVAQPWTGHFWMRVIEKERGTYPKVKMNYIPLLCMHCDEAPCIAAAPNGEVYKRPDGIVIIDPEKARGNKDLLKSCPYRIIYWNAEHNVPQKCTFCAHLLDSGVKEPRCVEVCPAEALAFGDLDDPTSEVSKRLASGEAEVLHPEYGIKERVSYIGLPKRFVAGTVVFGDEYECAEDVTVIVAGGKEENTVKTNNFGDFEFEGLQANTSYVVRVEHPKYKAQEFNINTKADVYLGEIVLA